MKKKRAHITRNLQKYAPKKHQGAPDFERRIARRRLLKTKRTVLYLKRKHICLQSTKLGRFLDFQAKKNPTEMVSASVGLAGKTFTK